MAKFYGLVGFAQTSETSPGVWTDTPIERPYYGDVTSMTKREVAQTSSTNDNLTTTNVISIVADPFAQNHFFEIKYVKWMGSVWKVDSVDVQRPRLTLRLGEVYNGRTA